MLPEICRRWCDVVGLYVEMAVRGFESAPPDATLLRATQLECRDISKATRLERTLIGTFAERLGLTIEEELAAWTLIAAQLVPTLGSRIEALGGAREPTCGAIAAVAFSRDGAQAIRAMSRTGSLIRHGLVELGDEALAWTKRPVVVSDRLMSLALLDASDEPCGGRFFAPRRETPPTHELAVDEETLAELREAFAANGDAIVAAIGLPSSGRASVLAAVAGESKLELVTIDAKRMAKDLGVFVRELRVAARECKLLDRIPLFVNLEALADDKLPVFVQAIDDAFEGRILLTSTKAIAGSDWSRPVSSVDMRPTNRHQRAKLWISALQQGSPSDGEHLAGQYPLTSGLIVRAADAARSRAKDCPIEPKHIAAGVRSVLEDRLGQFAKRLTVTQSWKDLVLSQDHVDVITELLARVRERDRVYEDWGFGTKLGKGLGVAALFSGPPGTGKTMVASLIAKDLGLEIYQVDLSKIVSKWIGESEKNLAALFDAAEAGHAVLLFDEADSMFGKRTDVKSSNDRYANLETNFLLQRLESFSGICLLTSNHESNIDPAFMRRLSLHLRFDVPDATEREHLWQALLPSDAPRSKQIDFARLAREYQLTGGYIRNAALRAAFLAVDGHNEITEEHLRKAARLECEAMGRIAA